MKKFIAIMLLVYLYGLASASAKDMTLINIILDRSGSMESMAREAVGSLNHYLAEQQKGEDYAELTLVQFDHLYERTYFNTPIKDCKPLLLNETYIPRGNTALLDAIGRTVKDTTERFKGLPKSEVPDRVLFVIITDGHENASKDYTKADIKSMIDFWEGCYCSKWKFIYLASGFDGFDEGQSMGFSFDSIQSFSGDGEGWIDVGTVMTNTSNVFRSGDDVNLSTEQP